MHASSRALFAAAFLVATSRLRADPPADASHLAGLWAATRSFGPEVRGALTLRREGGAWRAEIGGTRAAARRTGDEVRFSLDAGRGSFRGRIEGRVVRGHWVQPAGIATGVAWATPVVLQAAGRDVFRGTVTPLDESVTLFVDIRAEADGAWTAVLRNPDGWYRNGKTRIAVEGARVRLLPLQNGEAVLEGTYDAASDRLLLPITELKATLELARVDPDSTPGWGPRTAAERTARPAPRVPLEDGDGWRTAAPASVGLDEERLAALVRKLVDTDPRPQTAPLVHALLVARHGRLVLEEYFFGFSRERPHDMRSGGKTLASILAGVAIDRGAKLSPTSPVYALFRDYRGLANSDPRKERMTLEHLMTMTSGFDCDENRDDAPGNEDKMQNQTTQPDWWRFTLDLPLAAAPGDAFAYCSGAVNLIGGAVQRTTKRWLPELFDREIARPLRFGTYHFNLMPSGDAYLGGGIHLRPRDALKLGQLYLDRGVWNGRRVVSAAWVDASTRPHPMNAHGNDGWNWHLNELHAGGRVYKEYEANGNGGQFVIVVPELDLAVVFTAGNFGSYGVWRRFRDELLPEYLISAAKDR